MNDAELINIFADEAETRLTALASGLLRLEAGLDPDLIAELFREAHTIKGAAAVVGYDDVSAVAHRMEDLLQEIRAGSRPASAALVDTLLQAVDGLRAMIAALRAGEDLSERAAFEHAALDAFLIPGRVPNPAAPPPGPVAPSPAPAPPAPAPPTTPAPAVRAPDRTDAVRVPVARLDALVRLVGESAAANLKVGRLLVEQAGPGDPELDAVRDLSRSLAELQEMTMRARMVPISTITEPLQRATRDLARDLGKQVRWEARGGDTELDRGILSQLADPLLQLIRNALDHGIESGEDRQRAGKPVEAVVSIHAMQLGSEVIIAVTDDGGGIDIDEVRTAAARHDPRAATLPDDDTLALVFRPGLSTASHVTGLSGRGVGLDVVKSAVDAVRGRIEVRSSRGVGTEFRIRVPITLAVLRCLLVEAGGRPYAIPMHAIAVIATGSERAPVWVDGAPVDVFDLRRALHGDAPEQDGPEQDGPDRAPAAGPVVVVNGLDRRHGFGVDGLLGQRDVVVKGLPGLIPRNEILAGASIEPDGSVLCVLDGPGLVEWAKRAATVRFAAPPPSRPDDTTPAEVDRRRLLVVDDALTVRELQRAILERAGYDVRTAADGHQALATLGAGGIDLVLTDVEMPGMDGFALTAAIRGDPDLAATPVLILTSRATEEDRRRGMDAGADGYILKSGFDQGDLLAAVGRLVGSPR